MNKIRATNREMRDNIYIIGISYCKPQFLLNYESPVAYSNGVYGWACDYYDIDGVIISTGYRYINSKNTKATYEMITSYDDKARFIINNVRDYHQSKKAVKDAVRKIPRFSLSATL